MRILVALGLLASTAATALADDKVNIELNRIVPRDDVCVVSFLVSNPLPNGFSTFKLDLAFIDIEGVIDDEALVEFAPLRASKTRTRSVHMSDMDCSRITKVLLNDLTECEPTAGEGDAVTVSDCLSLVEISATGDLTFFQ